MSKEVVKKSMIFTITGLFIIMSIFTGISSSKNINGFDRIKTSYITQHRVIMLTGFWNPTGQMLIPFSTDPELNPDGWKGENWENLGYDIYSYFPKPFEYTGMFEVDYQDTWEDFWNVTNQIHPIAIISFGAGVGPWEIEYNARNLDFWINDGKPPYQPTPCPPDDTKPVGYVRHSSLPVQNIADAVNSQTTLNAWVDWYGDPGMYLCEYIAYLGMWYQDIHNITEDAHPCRTAGFIHVNSGVGVEIAMNATKITIRETIEYLSSINKSPDIPIILGQENGNVGEEYAYNFSTKDPDMDSLYYYIDWGDDTNSGWIGPYLSGDIIIQSHTWSKKGNYTIKAKAKDTFDAESDWGQLSVTMPTSYNIPVFRFMKNLFERFPNAFPLLRHFLEY